MTDTVTIRRELLPCPFCGCQPVDWLVAGTVQCSFRKCVMRGVHMKKERWNRRAALAAPGQGEAECRHCGGSGEVWGTHCGGCTTPPQPAEVGELVEALRTEFPLFDDEGLDQEKHHCEWSMQHDRKRLHRLLTKLEGKA